ncbi:MAG: hypothetical protein H6832_03530 [Planctomycetes bacterium]|nr:hypothetical protein [Planctomycetota bacterium]
MRALGIDGGGTRTRAVYLEDGVALRTLVGEATNPLSVGLDVAIGRVLALAQDASDGSAIDAIGIGIAGVGASESARESILDAVREAFPKARVILTTDVVAALAGAFDGGAGILVVGGTGSVAIGYSGERCVRVGGWGRRLGDAGSGFDLFRRAARCVLAAEDGIEDAIVSGLPGQHVVAGEVQTLRDAIVAALALERARDLVAIFARDPRPDELLLAVDVLARLAEDGDALCRSLLHVQADALAALALAVQAKLRAELAPLPVATAGGLLLGASILREHFDARLAAHAVSVVTPKHRPEVGAALLACAAADDPHGTLLAAARAL